MRDDFLIIFLIWILSIIQFLVNTFVGYIYPSFLEILLWYLLLFYPKKWYFIVVLLTLLEIFSLPPVTGFYIVLFFIVAGGLYLGKSIFYTESRLFIVFYLFLIEVVKWLVLDYIYLVLQVSFPGTFSYHLFYLLVQIIIGVFMFGMFDKLLKRSVSVELVE